MATILEYTVQNWNKEEEYFRTVIRKEKFPEWRIKKVVKRKLVGENGEVAYYKLGVYYEVVVENGKERRRQFTYYHNEYLKQNKRKRYTLEVKKAALDNYKTNKTIAKFLNKSTVQNWRREDSKEHKINEKVKEKIEKNFNSKYNNLIKYNVKKEHNNMLFVEMDDTYKAVQWNKRKIKVMVRMLTFNVFNSKTNKYECLNNVQIMFEVNKRISKYDEKNSIAKLIENIKNMYYNAEMKVCIKGDGAKNIKEIGKEFDLQILDRFHISKYIFDTFLKNKWVRNEEVKEFLSEFGLQRKSKCWWNIFNNFSLSEWNSLYIKMKKWFDNKVFKTDFKLALDKFLKYINNNKTLIFSICKTINKSSHTESYIRNFFKKHIDKSGALFGFKTIIDLVKINFSNKVGLLQIF